MNREELIEEFGVALQPPDVASLEPLRPETLLVPQHSVRVVKFLMANYQEIYREVTYSHYAKNALEGIGANANETRKLASKIGKYESTAFWLCIIIAGSSVMLSLARLFAG